MIRAENHATSVMKQHINYMYKYLYTPQNIHADSRLCPLKFAFKNNYASNGNMYRDVIEIKYIKENR